MPSRRPSRPPGRASRSVIALVVLSVVAASCGQVGDARRRPLPEPDVGLSGRTGPPGPQSWAPWPQALHDASHSGASTAVGPRTARLRWERRLEGDVTPGPVVGADGTIYASSNAGVLHAIDPATGEDRWTVDGGGPYGLDLSTSPAVLPSGIVLWPGPGGALLAIDSDGRELWRLQLGGLVTSPAARADGAVVVGTDAGRLVGLRPTREGPGEQWRLDLRESSYGSVALSASGDTAYQSVLSGVVAVRNGRVLWRWRVPARIVEVSAAVAPTGVVVIGTNDAYQYGLSPDDGRVLWRYRRDVYTYSSPGVTDDGVVYFGDHRDRVVGLDAASGALLFRHQGPTTDTRTGGIGIWTSVLVDAEHSVFVGTRQGFIYSVGRDGRRRWTYDAGATVDSYPALTADGALVIGVTDGRLLAFADR